jgi:hypothetical protein
VKLLGLDCRLLVLLVVTAASAAMVDISALPPGTEAEFLAASSMNYWSGPSTTPINLGAVDHLVVHLLQNFLKQL